MSKDISEFDPNRDDLSLALTDLRGYLRRSWHVLVACALLGAIIGAFSVRFAKPYYIASATIVPAAGPIEHQSSVGGGLGALVAIGSSLGQPQLSPFETFRIVLKSRALANAVLRDKRLAGILDPRGILWKKSNKGLLNLESMKKGRATLKKPNAFQALGELKSRILVKSDSDGTLTITFRASSSSDAQYALQTIMENADSLVRREYLENATAYLSYVRQQLADMENIDLRSALIRLSLGYERTLVMGKVGLPFSYSVIDPPRAPISPSGPSRLIFMVSGSILGFLVGTLSTIIGGLLPQGWKIGRGSHGVQ